MKNNLAKKIVFPALFSPRDCQFIFSNPGIRQNSVQKITNDLNYGNAKSYFLKDNQETFWLKERLTKYIREANEIYWNFSLEELKEIQLLEYREGDFFNWHIDLAGKLKSNSCRKINALLFLSEPTAYQGGNLLFNLNDETELLEQNQGDLVIFPSYLPHKVSLITSGLRYTLSAIFHGDSFS